jgi:hypothetical protein
VDVVASFPTDAQAAKAVQPRDRSLNDVAEDAPASAVRLAPSRDHGADPALPEHAAVLVVVVAAVGQQCIRAPAPPADPARDSGNLSSSGLSWVTSLRFPPVSDTASGTPCPSTMRWCLLPGRARSTGLGPLLGPVGRRGSRTGPAGPAPAVCPRPSSDPASATTARPAPQFIRHDPRPRLTVSHTQTYEQRRRQPHDQQFLLEPVSRVRKPSKLSRPGVSPAGVMSRAMAGHARRDNGVDAARLRCPRSTVDLPLPPVRRLPTPPPLPRPLGRNRT